MEALEAKIKVLEKDLYYYKKTSRDLKKQLQKGDVPTASSRMDESMPGSPQATNRTESRGTTETTRHRKQKPQVNERSQVHADRSQVNERSQVHSTDKRDGCDENGVGQLSVVARKIPSATFVRKPKKQLKQLR